MHWNYRFQQLLNCLLGSLKNKDIHFFVHDIMYISKTRIYSLSSSHKNFNFSVMHFVYSTKIIKMILQIEQSVGQSRAYLIKFAAEWENNILTVYQNKKLKRKSKLLVFGVEFRWFIVSKWGGKWSLEKHTMKKCMAQKLICWDFSPLCDKNKVWRSGMCGLWGCSPYLGIGTESSRFLCMIGQKDSYRNLATLRLPDQNREKFFIDWAASTVVSIRACQIN